jgi:hypothetical protein
MNEHRDISPAARETSRKGRLDFTPPPFSLSVSYNIFIFGMLPGTPGERSRVVDILPDLSNITAAGSRASAVSSRAGAAGSRASAAGSRASAAGSRAGAAGSRASAAGSRASAAGSRAGAAGSRAGAAGSRASAAGSRASAGCSRACAKDASTLPVYMSSHIQITNTYQTIKNTRP